MDAPRRRQTSAECLITVLTRSKPTPQIRGCIPALVPEAALGDKCLHALLTVCGTGGPRVCMQSLWSWRKTGQPARPGVRGAYILSLVLMWEVMLEGTHINLQEH